MNNEIQNQFYEELRLLCNKHSIKDGAFCGGVEGCFIGRLCVDLEQPTHIDLAKSAMNVAELFQNSKASLIKTMNIIAHG